MIATAFLESSAALLAVFAPLVAVPLSVITFYLRSIRETQVSRHAELVRRTELLEHAVEQLRRNVADVQRDYTSKEEWLRECMLARHSIDKLRERAARCDAMLAAAADDWIRGGALSHYARRYQARRAAADVPGKSRRTTNDAKRA